MLHQAALAACSIILMDNAFRCCAVQFFDRQIDFRGSLFFVAFRQSDTRFPNLCAGSAAVNAVMRAAFFILPVSLDCRLDICQNFLRN